jgi:hypothetical protein
VGAGEEGELTVIAKASYTAFVDGNRDAIERLIAPDFHFTSPLDNRIDRKTFFETQSQLHSLPRVRGDVQ